MRVDEEIHFINTIGRTAVRYSSGDTQSFFLYRTHFQENTIHLVHMEQEL
jgi:hypothetical protein